MYTLYGTPGSGAAAIEAALELAGLPYRGVPADANDKAQHAALLAVNPLGQVPTLTTPEGGVLTESSAILIHLGLVHPSSGLLWPEPGARAQTIRGLVFISANCYSAISIIDFPERWVIDPDEATSKRIRAGTRQRLHLHWSLFADQFGGASATPFLGGDAPGALDVLAAVVSKWSGARAHLRAERPDFFATLQRIDAHPVVDSVFARHWPA